MVDVPWSDNDAFPYADTDQDIIAVGLKDNGDDTFSNVKFLAALSGKDSTVSGESGSTGFIRGGAGLGSGSGGNIQIVPGNGGVAGSGGNIIASAGQGSGLGGAIALNSGSSAVNGSSGDIVLTTGTAAGAGNASGYVMLRGGDGGSGVETDEDGGNGGDIHLWPGGAGGPGEGGDSGRAGAVIFTGGLGNFADDAAAATGGVPVNGLYRTASAVKIRVS